jgi:hypothetical protein
VLSVKVGDRRLIPSSAVRAFVEQLVTEAEHGRDAVPA